MPSESSVCLASVAIPGRSSTRRAAPSGPSPALLAPEEDVLGDRQLGREREVLVDDLDPVSRDSRGE